MISFPTNPSDGMIYELTAGLFFQYDASIGSWIRIDGFNALGIATPSADGLMSSEDFKKIDGLIIPPLQTSIKGEECPVTFDSGKLRLTSTDESLVVEPKLDVMNKIGSKIVGSTEPWMLHENTVGINFKLNVHDLVEHMKKSGKFTQTLIQGKQGHKGERGDNGIDNLMTGPKGDTGPNGANSPFGGSIKPEINSYIISEQGNNRAIVDVHTEVGEDGNYLVVTRANIGNPTACPKEVVTSDFESPLLLVINQNNASGSLRSVDIGSECGIQCQICSTSLHYINIDTIIRSIYDRFYERVLLMKREKEELVAIWLKSMITLFNEQKQAICCAFENCRSSKRNERTRQYIEQQRIQAALGDLSLVIDGKNDRKIVPMSQEVCVDDGGLIIRRGYGCDCSVQYQLDGKTHSIDPRDLYLALPPGIVDTAQDGPYGSNRAGVLSIHQELGKPTLEKFTSDTKKVHSITRIIGNTEIVPPSQTQAMSEWTATIDSYKHVISNDKTGYIKLTLFIKQDNATVGKFEYTSDFSASTSPITLTPIGSVDFSSAVDITKKLDYEIEIYSDTTYDISEQKSSTGLDYRLGQLKLLGSSSIGSMTIDLKLDWNEPGYTVNGIQVANYGEGFAQFSLPAGEYVAEITDCCVNVAGSANLYQGIAYIEYNRLIDETTDAGQYIQRDTVVFPDLGQFNNNADAKANYIGSLLTFKHEGGVIRSWLQDPDRVASNNHGSMSVCIRPKACVDEQTQTNDDGAVFVYRGTISPLNLIGILHPFSGDIDAIANYGYNGNGASLTNGPAIVLQQSKSFFYSGPDGLSFFHVNGGSADANNIKMNFELINNSTGVPLKVADEISEVTSPSALHWNANWTIESMTSDGLVLGQLDLPMAGGAWALSVKQVQMGSHQTWAAVSQEGTSFNIAVDANGIGDSLINDTIIFTPIRTGCIMPYKQIAWLERGHRIGAACSCVVNINGQDYIVVKRSIGNDVTCGGGEDESNPCVSLYTSVGLSHPAIAWPTTNSEEFLGIPTSGYHGFVYDQDLSDLVVSKIAAGDMSNVNGDPATNIKTVLFPAS